MARSVELANRYLQKVLNSNNGQLILNSANALLDEISNNCDPSQPLLQIPLVKVLQLIDKKVLQKQPIDNETIKDALEELKKSADKCPKGQPQPAYKVTEVEDDEDVADSEGFQENSEQEKPTKAEEENLDSLLKQLNLRQVPAFAPSFPQFETESDDEVGVTTQEKKEERAEKHGQKLCEEEVQRLPDGREVRMKKTKTVNVQQTTKHITISTRGGGCPEVSRKFTEGDRAFDEDNEEESTDFFNLKRGDPFEKFRKTNEKLDNIFLTEVAIPGESTKTKTVERTSEVLQSVSEKKEKNGRLLGEHAASKADSSQLIAKQTDNFRGETLLDRKGEGTYEETCIVKRGLPAIGETVPPRKHVVEYIQTFGGNKETSELEYLRGTTISSYISLNDNLRFHEQQFRKKLQFEFSAAGSSSSIIDFGNLAELLEVNDLGALKLPTKWAIEDVGKDEQKAIDWQPKASITYEEDLICALNVAEYLVFRERDGRASEVRGAPRDALIVFATQGNSASLIYQEAFLVTYRTFIMSLDLINKLIKRYLFMLLARDRNSQSAARNTFSVLVRVVDELTMFEINEPLIISVTSFVYRLIHDGNLTFARILRQRLLDRIKEPFNASIFLDTKISSPRRNQTIHDFRSSAVACQLTYIDTNLFHRIESPELLWWAQEQSESKSPNLVIFTEHFNNVSFWVRTQVITQPTQKDRERYMMKFVKIMRHLRKMGNFNSYLAILSALVSSPLARLEWNKTVQDSLKEHVSIMDTAQSYKNYRALLQAAQPPCVPYIGVVLQDLTFVHAGNPDKMPPKLCAGKANIVNFLKRWHQYAILDSIRKLKKWNYDIAKEEKVIQFFDHFQNRLGEEETWAKSHLIKPPNRRRQ